ncbi:hypothetical protein BDR03DRAFT_979766 [Suillus americanus]|nr:hypothetical protein BDR03DRAFT_979766 [Suillus americanus]
MPLCCLYPHPAISETPAHYTEYDCRIRRLGYDDTNQDAYGGCTFIWSIQALGGWWWVFLGIVFAFSIKSHEVEPPSQAGCSTQHYEDPQLWDSALVYSHDIAWLEAPLANKAWDNPNPKFDPAASGFHTRLCDWAMDDNTEYVDSNGTLHAAVVMTPKRC